MKHSGVECSRDVSINHNMFEIILSQGAAIGIWKKNVNIWCLRGLGGGGGGVVGRWLWRVIGSSNGTSELSARHLIRKIASGNQFALWLWNDVPAGATPGICTRWVIYEICVSLHALWLPTPRPQQHECKFIVIQLLNSVYPRKSTLALAISSSYSIDFSHSSPSPPPIHSQADVNAAA